MRAVKKSTVMLPPRSWHHGSSSDTQIASPTCTSSKSPWIGCMPSERGTMLATDISAIALSSAPPSSAAPAANT